MMADGTRQVGDLKAFAICLFLNGYGWRRTASWAEGMSKQEESLCRVFGSCRKISGLAALAAVAVLVLGNGAWGQLMAPTLDMGPGIGVGNRDNGGGTKGEAGADRAIRLLTLAPVPKTAANNTAGAMYSFDISFVDQETQTYYLADRSNAAVDVVDAKTGKFSKQIPASPAFKGFTGSNATSGPNGVVAAFPWLFVTDGNSRVITIDLRNDTTVSDVSTGGAAGLRADELAYDPDHGNAAGDQQRRYPALRHVDFCQ
jgi:hypothetical protein